VTAASQVLAGAHVVTPDAVLAPGWIRVADGRIADLGPGSPPDGVGATELTGRWILPGFVDIHVHGGGGASFTEGGAEQARQAAAFHRAHGSTRIVASLVTAPLDEMARRAAMLADLADEGVIDGIHLEGPFLSHARCGAQDPRYLIDPDVAAFKRLLTASRGRLRQITIAPELPGAIALIRAAVEAGVVAAAGHTDATAQATAAGIDAGVTHATHLFNGSRPLDHREPGPPGALLDRQVTCEAIADGTHLHDMTIRLIWRAAGPGNLVLVTDAMGAAGMPDGRYRLGPQEVDVSGGVARLAEGLPGAGSIAGSTATMAHCVRRALRNVQLPVLDVAAAASTTPARVVGLGAETGALRPGLAADLVVLDADLRLTAVMARGQWVDGAGG
jgi:N-acetylglucosamine-6-phosphate deacetylase